MANKTVTKKASKAKASKAAKALKAAPKAKKAKAGVGAFVYALIAKGANNVAIQEAVAESFPGSALVKNPSAHIGWYRCQFNKQAPAKGRKPAAAKKAA